MNFCKLPVNTNVCPSNLLSVVSSSIAFVFIPASSSLFNKSFVCSCAKNSTILFAITSPMSFISCSSSNFASASACNVLYFLASSLDAFPPTCLIPNAVISLYKSFCLLFSILFFRFCANFFPFFLSDAISSKLSE